MTPAQIKDRLEQAGRTLGLLAISTKPREYGNNWPDIIRSAQEFFVAQVAADKDQIEDMLAGHNRVRVRPLQKQISEMDEAFSWLNLITDQRWRRIVALRTIIHPYTERYIYGWRKLGREMGIHENTARNWHEKGIQEIRWVLSELETECPKLDRRVS